MDIYHPIPTGVLTRKFRPQHRKQLLDLLYWYDLVSGGVTLFIVFLVVVPLIRHVGAIYAVWPIGYALYVLAKLAVGPWMTPMQPAVQWAKTRVHKVVRRISAVTDRFGLVFESRHVHYLNALLLTILALTFSIAVRRADEHLGLSVEYDGALWLLFVLPILRLARYGSLRWLIAMTALAWWCIAFTHAVADDPFTITSMRLIAIQCAWLILICLLPGVLATYLTEVRYGLEAADAVVRKIACLPFVSEGHFLNRATGIIQEHFGYTEVNVLLPTMTEDGHYTQLRLAGAATTRSRTLVEKNLAIDVSEGKGVTVAALVQRELQVVNDVERDAKEQGMFWGHELFENIRSEMALPILLNEKLFGVLDIESDESFAFSEDDAAIMHAIVNCLAMALDDHYNLEQIEGLHAASHSITRYLFSQNAVQPMLEAIASAARQALAASSVVLYAWDPIRKAFLEPVVAGTLLVAPASAAEIAQPDCNSIVRRVMRRAERQIRLPNAADETESELWMLNNEARGDFVQRAKIETSIAFPLYGGGAPGSQAPVLGAVFINYTQARMITASHRQWCKTLSSLASLALQNAWLHEQIIDDERGDLWAEIHDGMVQDAWIMRDAMATVADTCERALPLTTAERRDLERAIWCSTSIHREVNYLTALWSNLRQRGAALGAYVSDGSACGIPFFSELHQFALIVQQSLEVTCTCECEGDDAAIPGDVQHALWMIMREAVRNAWRHGRAEQIRIRICVESNEVTLLVSDDGGGFWPDRVRVPRGLNSMQRRARSCGGEVTVRSTPGNGAAVHATIPLAWSPAAVERVLPDIPSISVLGSSS